MRQLSSYARPGFAQVPPPGFGEKYCCLSGTPSHSLASAGGSFLSVILGHSLAYSVLMLTHFSRPGSVSGLITSTGHSGSQTPQSIHSSDQHVLALVEAIHGADFYTIHQLTFDATLIDYIGHLSFLPDRQASQWPTRT